MRRPRNQRSPITLSRIPPNWERILITLGRYRYLDTAHIFLLTGWTNTNAEAALRKLYDAGLIDRLPNNRFRRDRLKDGQVYELTDRGHDYLEQNNLKPPKVTWLKGGNYGTPDHNLKLCLLLASLEATFTRAGRRFIAWEEIYATLPDAARKLASPYRFTTAAGDIVPDALFSVQYSDEEYLLYWVELDLSAHGEKEYECKTKGYSEVIFKGLYKQRFNMAQDSRVLTITNSLPRREAMARIATDKPFLFKAITEYGDFQKAPQPALTILTGWHRAKHPQVNLTEM